MRVKSGAVRFDLCLGVGRLASYGGLTADRWEGGRAFDREAASPVLRGAHADEEARLLPGRNHARFFVFWLCIVDARDSSNCKYQYEYTDMVTASSYNPARVGGT